MRRQGDEEIAAFKKVIPRALGHCAYPPEVNGDLSDLLGTLRQGVELLEELMKAEEREDVTRVAHRLEILIEDDLPMIFRDLLPNLKKIVKELYEILGDSEEFS